MSVIGAFAIATAVFAASDWAAVLKDYEKVTDELVALYPKLKTGDTAAAQQVSALTPKYSELAAKIAAAAATELTPEQLKKFQEIGAKYQKAMTP
jgi:hypothetical protein